MRLTPPNSNQPDNPVNANNSVPGRSESNANPQGSTNRLAQQAYIKAHQQISRYLDVLYDKPWESPNGNLHESSSIQIPAGARIVNSRSTPEGRRADSAARRGVYQKTGMHPGHDHPTQLGVDPSDTRNIRPQNAIQNGARGTWYENEKFIKKAILANPDLGYSQTVTRVTRPGEDAPFYRKIESTFSDGTTFGDNVLYGNFPSPASRSAAENGGLKPGIAGPLDKQFKDDVEAQMKPAPETEADGNQFARVKAMRQLFASMTPEQNAAYVAERSKLVLPNLPEPPTDTPPDGRSTDTAPSVTLSQNRTLRTTDETASEPDRVGQPESRPGTRNQFGAVYELTSLDLASWTPSTPSGSLASNTLTATAGPASGSATISALGYDTTAYASAGLQNNALTAREEVGADAYLGKAAVGAQLNLPAGASLSGNGSAMVGAGATESGQVALDPLHGTVACTAEVNAFAGARAQGAISADAGPLGAMAEGDIGAGIGLDAQADVGVEKGKVTFDLGFQAYLGVGGGGNLSFSADLPQMANDAGSLLSGAGQDAGNLASIASHDVTRAWDSATGWL